MQSRVREIQYFFYSQAFADGLRATAAILTPALIGFYIGNFDLGFTIALGALCVSLTDAPGPLIHKRNGMLFTAFFIFVVAVITSLCRANPVLLGVEIVLLTFFFSLFTLYGNRASAVGNAAILMMILTMDKPVPPGQVLPHALYIFGGGIFYTIVSLLLYFIRPFRPAQRALGDCIREVAAYLATRADFYNTSTDLEQNYGRLVNQQVRVNEKQDTVREIFFKTRQIVEESSEQGRRLIFTFVETVDLFEDITAAYYDYALLRKQFGESGALDLVHDCLQKIVGELDSIGIAIQTNTSHQRSFDYDEEVRRLKASIDSVILQDNTHRFVLRKIVVNIRNLLTDLIHIQQYFEPGIKRKKSNVDHSHFVSHQSLDPKLAWNNLTLQSSVFRHAIRVSVACIIGYLVGVLMAYGSYSYWILLTIAFILKPAFSLTKQRNVERIMGTLAGGAIGIVLLVLIPSKTVLFVLMVLFMLGTYTFLRTNYLLMVICTTPYVLILFSFFGAGFQQVAKERVLDTLIGCAIAFSISYLLFPRWESDQLKVFIRNIVRANKDYMEKIVLELSGKGVSMLEYKLARRQVYLHSANLSAAFQRMLSEPKSKQNAGKQVHTFVVLNHILFSNVATVSTTLLSRESRPYPAELVHLSKKAVHKLEETQRKLGDTPEALKVPEAEGSPELTSADDQLMKEQLQFILKVSSDIEKISQSING